MGEERLAERYQPLEIVGRGGEATVLKAVDTRHERLVALKVRMVPPNGSAGGLLAEARALLSLPPHAGLAHARDDLFDGNRYVLVLDWVEGVNLARLLAQEGTPGLPVSSVLHWVAQVAEALTVLHQHAVVHGDVKPANLILDHTGHVVLVDLGSSSSPLASMPRGGTSGFRAPEVAAGLPALRASDVFSLAATAFALLTGTSPTGDRPRWLGMPAEVGARLESALRAGLAVDPARRPATPAELVERLRAGWDDQTPTGAGTVLLTDVVESTKLWELSPDRVPSLLAEMQLAVDRSVEAHGGRRFGATVEGDATMSVFANALSAVRAAIALQRALTSRSGTVRVRAGLATGELVPIVGDLLGPTVHRAARVRDLARAGEILLSASTADVARWALPEGIDLMPLGPHPLRGLEGLDEIAAVVTEGVSAPPDPTRSPYPGLAPFGRDDADLFVGRDDVVERSLDRFRAERFVAVVGASGSGKSSVILAGIAPRLHEVVIVRPGVRPGQSLERAGIPWNESAVLIVDQLEELVTVCHEPAERAAFVDAVVAHPGGLVVAVRADLYGEFSAFPELAERLASSQVLLGPLAEADLLRAVREPARQCGLVVEDGLAELIAAEVGEAPGALPLLGHALRETWLRREGRTITLAGYRAAGGVRSAIAATAERALAALDEQGQAVAHRLLLSMVELRAEGEDARRWASRREVTDVDSQQTEEVVQTLIEARLLVIDHDQITVAHEALLRAWPRFKGWIAEERADLLARQELRWAAERWEAGGRSETDLYRGPRLDNALGLAAREGLPPREKEFLAAGGQLRDREHAEARRRARRLRMLAAVTSVLAAVAIAVGVVAVVQRNDAQHARATADAAARTAQIEALVGRAESMRATQRDAAALLAVEAFRLDDTARTRSALLSTFTDSSGFYDTHRLPAAGRGSGIVLPDGESAYYNFGGRLYPYDLDAGTLADSPFPPSFKDPLAILAASPDGALVAQAARTGSGSGVSYAVAIYDTATGQLRFPPVVVDGEVTDATFTNGRPVLAVSFADGHLIAFHAATGVQVATEPGAPVTGGEESRSGLLTVNDEVLLGSASDGTVRVFDAGTFEPRRTLILPPGTSSRLRDVGDGTIIAAGPRGLERIDVATGAVRWEHRGQDLCSELTVIAARHTFYCGRYFGRVEERDLVSGSVLRRLGGHNGASGTLWPARGGRELVSFSTDDPLVERWRLDGSGPITSVVAPGYTPVQFSPRSRRLIVDRGEFGANLASEVVDVESGDVLRNLVGLKGIGWTDEDTVVGEASDGTKVQLAHAGLAGGGIVLDGVDFGPVTVRIQADTGKERLLLGAENAGGWELRTFDLATQQFGAPIAFGASIPSDVLNSMDISRGGDRVAIGTHYPSIGVLIYDGASGEQIGQIVNVNGAYITPADQLFATSYSGRLTQYDLGSNQPIRSFGGSRGFVQQVVGTSDGTLIAARSGDGSISLYDVATGVGLGTPLPITENPVDARDADKNIALSLDGTRLAVPTTDGVQVWDLEPQHWVDAACRVAGRNLTREEWDSNIGTLAPYRASCRDIPRS
jgi:class 3 adenylate cyclase/WD40 repeat protein